jgi:hypothetical protein
VAARDGRAPPGLAAPEPAGAPRAPAGRAVFRRGRGALLAPDTPVAALASSVAFGGARVEDPDGGALGTVARKLSYLVGTGDTHPFAYQYDAIDAPAAIVARGAARERRRRRLRGFWCHAFGALKAAGPPRDRELPDSNTRLAREMSPERRRSRPRARPGLQPRAGAPPRAPAPRLGGRDLGPDRGERDEMRRARAGARIPRRAEPRRRRRDAASHGGQDGRRRRTLPLRRELRLRAERERRAAARRARAPLVRRERPGARLCLVGGGMAPGLRAAVTNAPGVEAPGFVDDLDPWYRPRRRRPAARARGRGMLFKTVEALARGLATVGFPEAYRGIDADPESAFLTAPDEPAMARAASRLLADASARRMLGTRARRSRERALSFEHGVRAPRRLAPV